MLFNKDFLFLHIPRTAGKCIKSSIIPFLEKPVYLAQKYIDYRYFSSSFIRVNPNLAHSSLEELIALRNKKEWDRFVEEKLINKKNEPNLIRTLNGLSSNNNYLPDLDKIKTIIVCCRNPLDRARSLHKLSYSNKSFEYFLSNIGKTRTTANMKNYCNIKGKIPENLKFINFSSIEKDLCNILNLNKIDIKSKKHNEILDLNEKEIYNRYIHSVKDIDKAVDIINDWEEWAIKNRLVASVTKKDFLKL